MLTHLLTLLKKHATHILLFILALGVYSYNLTGQQLSLDEPETILVSRGIWTAGVPSPWDGKNFVSINNGSDSTYLWGRYIWQWHPWMMHIITFATEFVLNPNQLELLRFPFVISGAITIVCIYIITKKLFKKSWIAVLLSIQALLFLPMFLYVRQIRYYSLEILLTLIFFWILYQKKKIWMLMLCITCAFFSNYIVGIGLIMITLLTALWRKDRVLLFVSVFMGIGTMAWYILFTPYQGDVFLLSNIRQFPLNLVHNLSYISTFMFPLLLIPILFFSKRKSLVYILFGWIGIKLFLVSIFLTPHGRFLIDMFPLFLILYGIIYEKVYQYGKIPVLLLFLILSLTNAVEIIPFSIVQQKIPMMHIYPKDMMTEYTKTYPSILREIGSYMKGKYTESDLFWSNAYTLPLYLYSDVPSLSPVCTQNTLTGPTSITDPIQVRWFIFFPDTRVAQDLRGVPCLGAGWQNILETSYDRVDIEVSSSFYLPNDPDIINRSFSQQPVDVHTIRIYEKRTK